MRRDFLMPIIVLACICLFMSGALAVGNGITRPIIELAAAERAEAARKDAIPHAEEFVLVAVEGLPKTIREVYGTSNNVGYIFMVTSAGYGGDIRLICAIGPDGRIIKNITLEHTETKGFGDRVFAREAEYIGKASLEGIDVVSGATISSNAYMNGIRDAFNAFQIVMGASR